MNLTLNNISFSDFINQFETFNGRLLELKNNSNYKAEDLENLANSLFNDVNSFLDKRISPEPKIIKGLLNACIYSYLDDDFGLRYDINKSSEPKLERQKLRLKRFLTCLKLTQDYLFLTDSLTKGINSEEPKGIQSKKDFILEKLLQVFNDSYYDISIIFDLNGIHYRTNEPVEIANDLERREYLSKEERYSNNSTVRLTVKGASYIERKINSKRKTIKIPPEIGLHEKINIILSRLEKLGLGQEIIFNEFEEMRDLDKKLSKKSWVQLLKGKLFDLTVSNLINKEMAGSIFEFLTDEKLKFLK